MRWLFAVLCLSFASASQAAFTQTIVPKGSEQKVIGDKVINTTPLTQRRIDKVLVLKSSRQLQLISEGEALKTYRISLGKNPKGAKLQEGDKRTPEGFYWLDWRKPSNKYNLSMHISYPNAADSERSRREGVKPGSMIMIHGTPIDEEYPEWYFHTLDWTEGCIAMKNNDMREVWDLVKDGTLIEIRP
ncbi:L,D-transpeptidase family protein [Pseudomonas sp. DTU_2021_1001937_2_SI_NGA_ILE_001]|uniref:L,D-transpeptidase family protein n=1 Tax=Pseudomonas sp. DTU_2021_1001937_2_SI_NGA_ILE_001 TaxID=3077589 RepID=UPI0025F3FF7A|nr:L,D-transpeptidase family protein [Pseudomonas sp. DTU_2021_1001937_2_SI_NGA_ILE_001]WNW11550.1 L,D-transpeptidase family protein [Pseudomonas sp. DTU_2021_1001937_2_SI_NGA_ILE_001]